MSVMEVRPARPDDLERILEIYAAARAFMAHTGNPTQWAGGYPPRAVVEQDIASAQSYVLTRDGTVHGVFFLAPGPDPTYAVIEDGAWPDETPYGVIHRIAGDGQAHGVLQTATAFAAQRFAALRIDTHRDNHVMQRAIAKAGFTRCGIIRLENGDPRIAYQRTTTQ